MARHEIEALDPTQNTAVLTLDAGLYPLDAIYGAAYALIDQAWVLLDREPMADGKGHRVLVHLRGKMHLGEAGLHALSGTFGNELLSQVLRRKVVKQNSKIIEEIVTQAIAGAAGATGPQEFLDGDDDLDFLDDPLGIAVPWEEKFKKDKGSERS